jgi:hypothetical protein
MPKSKQPLKTEFYYKRKDGIETNNPAMAWFDLVSYRLYKIGLIILLLNIPFQQRLPAVWRYVKNLW